MKKLFPLAFVLSVFTAGAAIALAPTINHVATHAGPDAVSGRPVEAAPSIEPYLVPGCRRHKPLCDLETY
jgi:hypothetical protein